MNILRLYQNAYKRRPLLTHAFESGLIMAAADVISQVMVENKCLRTFDVERSLRFGGIGIFFVAPARVGWYKILERRLPGFTPRIVGQKLVLDQVCFAPFIVLVLVSSVSFANGMQPEEVLDKIKTSYKDIMLNNWKVWPCVQLCNFYLVPAHLRMTTVQMVSFVWNIYLSWKANFNKSLQSS